MGESAKDRALRRKAKKLSSADNFKAKKKGFGLRGGKWVLRRGVWVYVKK